jgi:hypothetical protein
MFPKVNTNIGNRDFSVAARTLWNARSVENIAKFRRHLKCTTEPIHHNSNKQTNNQTNKQTNKQSVDNWNCLLTLSQLKRLPWCASELRV